MPPGLVVETGTQV